MKEYSKPFTALTPEMWALMYRDIREFRATFRLKLDEAITDADCRMHQALHIEELVELALANDKVEQADAITDFVYTCLGRNAQIGDSNYENSAVANIVDIFIAAAKALDINFEECWKAVHASNMTKAAESESVAISTVEHYEARGVKAEYNLADNGTFVVSCSEDWIDETGSSILKGKVLKSVEYTPVDLSFVLNS